MMNRTLSHPARVQRSLASITILVISLFALAACETTGMTGLGSSSESRIQRMVQNGEHAAAAGAYMGMAVVSAGSERDRYTLLAVEQYLDAGDVTRARNAFGGVAEQTTGALLPLWRTNRAAFHLYSGNADAALGLLEPLSREPLTQRDRLRVEVLRADAWIQKQDPARAIELMTQRENWLDDRRDIENNRMRLWQGLLVSSPMTLRAAADINTDPEVRGWLTLASIATSTGRQGIGWSKGVTHWRAEHPQHPALTVLGEVELPEHLLLEYPRQVALLLPLSGGAASAGKAIQNGFLGAYFATASGLDDRQQVRIYDVNREGGASAAYAAA